MNIITSNDKDLPTDLQAIANEAVRITINAIECAAAHMRDPVKFSLPANAVLENAALKILKLRQTAKPRQLRSLQLRSVANLSRISPTTIPVSTSLATRLRIQPSLSHGIINDLKAMNLGTKALKLNTATSVAIDDAVATQNTEKLFDTLGLTFSNLSGSASAASSTVFTKLILNIDRVRCLDDVGLEFSDFFEDDIRLGGLGADSTGQKINIKGIKVGNFKKGETVNFKPNRKFVEFDLTRAGNLAASFQYNIPHG